MNPGPSVIVNKSGFFTSLVKGVFGTIMVIIICGTAVGLYGMRLADNFVDRLSENTIGKLPEVLQAIPDWSTLPPIVADALNDRRALDYRPKVTLQTEYHAASADRGVVAITVTNHGDEVISLLSLRLLVEDEGAEYVDRQRWVASPFACDNGEWPGPLAPGASRKLLQRVFDVKGEPVVTVELGDLRVWNGPLSPQPRAQASAATADSATMPAP